MMANALVEPDQEEAAAVVTSNEKRIYQGSAAGMSPRDGSKRPRLTLFRYRAPTSPAGMHDDQLARSLA
jgi:hypothetical protein